MNEKVEKNVKFVDNIIQEIIVLSYFHLKFFLS